MNKLLLLLTIQQALPYLAQGVLVVAAIVSALRFRFLPVNLKYLVWLVGFGVVAEVIEHLLWLNHKPNLFIGPLFAAGEFWFLSLVYAETLDSPSFSQVRPWLAGGFIAYCLVDSLLAPAIAHFKPALQLVESMLVLGLIGLYFRKLLNELRVTRLDLEPMFWVSTGLVINHLGNVQIYLFSNFLLKNYSNQLNLNIWAIHALLLVILYSCYCVALWIRPQN